MDFYNISYFCVEMSSEAFASVNVPVSVSSVLLNIFFVFCLIFPQEEAERLKQPLKTLLGSLVRCNISIHICIFLMVLANAFIKAFKSYTFCFPSIAIYIMMISVNSSHWLNVFYCFQIIPVQHPYFIWFKRNIRVFIYCAVIFNASVCLLGMSVTIGYVSLPNNDDHFTEWRALQITDKAISWIRLSLFLLSLCVMLASSCVTVVFLWRHVKNMEKSSGSFFSPRRHRHLRVTIISITVQALLHITCSALVIIDELISIVSIISFDFKRNMLCTVISFYSFGTTVNLGMSQSVFRQRAVHIWQKCFRPHSSLSALTTAQTILSNILSS